jgi:hypothetical protein
MLKIIICAAVLAVSSSAFAKDVYVKPQIRSDGTYVEGHYRTSPNSTKLDNYSTEGNYNPHTGEIGTKNPYNDGLNTPRLRKY